MLLIAVFRKRFYDVVIWSQTNWRYLEGKLIELGLLAGTMRCHIPFVLDKKPMFPVYSMRNGKPFKHEVKPLEIIWKKFPQVYNATNSIHLDDLSRNFALNPQNGLKIKAFKDAAQNQNDSELVGIARYLLQISSLPDLSHLNHDETWEHCTMPLPEGVADPRVTFLTRR